MSSPPFLGQTGQPPTVSSVPPAAYWIRQVKSKLATAEYVVEPSKCLCGLDDDVVVREHDRYGIPHRMVLCRECGLIRANPRMTESALRAFYETEYRLIYDGWEFGNASDLERFEIQALRATTFAEFIGNFNLRPQIVYDIGCNTGELLVPFKDAGAKVVGLEWDISAANLGCHLGLDILNAELDTLEQRSEKADLIILQQVIEHLIDPIETLRRLRGLLTPRGLLFVGTPSLYTTPLHLLFQNAHLWQFTSDTLAYVMNLAGLAEMYLDERIWSLWCADDIPTGPSRATARYVERFLAGDAPVPIIKTINKFPLKDRVGYVDDAVRRRLPDISELIGRERDHEAIVIGGGPSIDDQVDKIRALNTTVITIERMNRWCRTHDIIPDYVLTLDASEDVKDALVQLAPTSIHLVAAQCHPTTFDILANERVYLFHTPQRGLDLAEIWDRHNVTRATILNAGGSVTLGAISAAMLLGCRTIHLFGFDCMFDVHEYATGIAGVGEQKRHIQITVDSHVVETTYSYLSFAQQLHLLIHLAKHLGHLDRIVIYGNSLAKLIDATGQCEDGDASWPT